MSIESIIPFNYLILFHLLLLLPTIFLRIRVFYNESTLCNRWPKYWSFNFSINPFCEYSVLISLRINCFDLLASSLSRVFLKRVSFKSLLEKSLFQESSPAPQLESFISLALSLLYGPTLTFISDYRKKP